MSDAPIRVTADRVKGMFLGIAIGDALGIALELRSKEEIAAKFGRVTKYIRPDGHKMFDGSPAGTVTDDTELSLIVAESLIAKGKIDLDDLSVRHIEVLKNPRGYGKSTLESIRRLKSGVHWSESGKTDKPGRGTGNGVAMKIAPLAAYIAIKKQRDPDFEFPFSKIDELTFMTHATPMAKASAYAQILAVLQCLEDKKCESDEDSILAFNKINAGEHVMVFAEGIFIGLVEMAAKLAEFGDSKAKNEKQEGLSHQLSILRELVQKLQLENKSDDDLIKLFGGGTCYILHSLPFTYAFFLRKPYSIEALYDVVNAGGDTDSNGSMLSALLGALNGTKIFSAHLVDDLPDKEKILDVANRFCDKFGIRD